MNRKKSIPDDLRMATTALILTAIVASVLAVAAWTWLRSFSVPDQEPGVQVQYLEQYIEVAQVIVVGVFVTLVSVIIQFMIPEARDRFERYKESRQAYSRAKTAVLYLPDRVANSNLENAFILVEEAHRELHLAETFEDEIISKGYLEWFYNPKLWTPYNYWQIVAVAEVLRLPAVNFEDKNELRERLDNTLKVVHGRFGERGQHCKGEKWGMPKEGSLKEKEKCRWAEEEQLRTDIKQTAGKAAEKTPEIK